VTTTEPVAQLSTPTLWSLSSLNLDSLRDARVVKHDSSYDLDSGTIAFNIEADSTKGRQGLFSKDYADFGDGGHLTVWLWNGEIVARIQSDNESFEINGGTIKAGEEEAVAITFGGDGFNLYVGGNLVAESITMVFQSRPN